jgi:uncharacterized protein YecT (DUF1311 family)
VTKSVAQLEELLNRQGRSTDILDKIEALRAQWSKLAVKEPPVSDFFPMRAVTLLEVFSKGWLATLIDHGSPFRENASKLELGGKIGFDLAVALEGKKFSVGWWIGNSVSLNQFEQYLGAFTKITGRDVAKALESTHDRTEVEVYGRPIAPIINDRSVVFAALKRLFEVRHILTHEVPALAVYGVPEVDVFLAAVSEFARATNQTFLTLLFGDYPIKALDMIYEAQGKREAVDAQLAALLADLQQRPEVDQAALRAAQSAWEQYSEAQATLRASVVAGGSYERLVYVKEMTRLAEVRRDELNWWVNREEGDIF